MLPAEGFPTVLVTSRLGLPLPVQLHLASVSFPPFTSSTSFPGCLVQITAWPFLRCVGFVINDIDSAPDSWLHRAGCWTTYWDNTHTHTQARGKPNTASGKRWLKPLRGAAPLNHSFRVRCLSMLCKGIRERVRKSKTLGVPGCLGKFQCQYQFLH